MDATNELRSNELKRNKMIENSKISWVTIQIISQELI